MEMLTVDSRSHSGFLPLQSVCFAGSRRELSVVCSSSELELHHNSP